jgi:ribonuclease P protein component
LPAKHRLKHEKDFATLAKSRKSVFGKLVGMKVRENSLPHSRFGIVVGLKVHKRAVKRNIVKRRIREILRAKLVSIKPGYDVMIMALPPAVPATMVQIEAEISKELQKIGLTVVTKA